jgi:gamma-carbonic anhydrase
MNIMPNASILPYKGVLPTIGKNSFLASGAHLIGDFICGEDCSFWFNTVVRADCNFIRMGDRTNVQDGTVIHVTNGTGPTYIGSDVTIGHNATLHACTIHDKVLIGMGAVVLDGAVISSYSYVAAGALVSPGKTFPEGVLIKGNPATVARELTEKERAYLKTSIEYYLEYKSNY